MSANGVQAWIPFGGSCRAPGLGENLKKILNSEHRALFLLISILLFLILTPFLQDSHSKEGLLVASMYLTLVAATMELSGRRVLFWSAVPLAATSMAFLLLSHIYFYEVWWLQVASFFALGAFLGLVSAALFAYLVRPGAITKGRLYVSVSIYFLLGLSWFVFFQLINLIQPGSFAEAGAILHGRIEPSKLLYFSLATLTTLGYGDIVAVKPAARMLATLEAAAGVLYIAIFVASLIGSYQSSGNDKKIDAERRAS